MRRAHDEPSLSIAVSAHANPECVESCLMGFAQSARRYEHEIFLVGDAEELFDLAGLQPGLRRIRVSGPTSLARRANAVMTAASGDLLLFLDPDFGCLDPEGLDELLGRMREPDVGAVGPILVREDETVESAGHVLGVKFAAADKFRDRFVGAPAYGDLLRVAHEASSVAIPGMMTRRSLFRHLDGFDEIRFRRTFADVDYCLRLRALGHRIVVAPKAILRSGDASRMAPARNFTQLDPSDRDLVNFRSRWGGVLINDPFYNPCLSLDAPFGGLAWPPRSLRPRSPETAAARSVPPGF